MNHAPSRYSKHFSDFEGMLKKSLKEHGKNKLTHVGTFLHANNGRTPYFQLQGLARIDSKAGKDKEKAEQWLLDFKQIEDAIGKFDYWNSMIINNKRWKFPKPIADFFVNQAYLSLGVLEERLIDAGWLTKDLSGLHYSGQAMKSFEKSIKKMDFHSPSKERKKLLQLFRDEVIEIHEKVKSGEIDLNHIELGIHEFRRKARWIGIYASALLGKVILDKNSTGKPLGHFVTADRSALKFNQLPVNEKQEDPVYYLRGGFYAMSDLISIIGEIKDPGLATEEMIQLGKLFGMKESEVKKHLGSDYYPHTKVVQDAQKKIRHYLFKENILQHIAEHFDKQLK